MAPDRIAEWQLSVSILNRAKANQHNYEIMHRDVVEREEVARIRLWRTEVFSEIVSHNAMGARAYTEWATAVDNLHTTMHEVNNAVSIALQNVQRSWNALTRQEHIYK